MAEVPTLAPYMFLFGAIGFGFMFIEISLMQKLMIFLGYPTHSLAVVLFTLLLSSGLGSWTTGWLADDKIARRGLIRLLALLGVLILFGLTAAIPLELFRGAATPVRIAISILLIAPLGLFMGMVFPMGLRSVTRVNPDWAPLLWAINGAGSVCGSVLAVAISVNFSISATFYTGLACYIVAALSFALLPKSVGSGDSGLPLQ